METSLLIINIYTSTMINLALQVVYQCQLELKLYITTFLYKKEQQTIILIILTLVLDCPTLCSVYKIYSTTFVCTCSRFSF